MIKQVPELADGGYWSVVYSSEINSVQSLPVHLKNTAMWTCEEITVIRAIVPALLENVVEAKSISSALEVWGVSGGKPYARIRGR